MKKATGIILFGLLVMAVVGHASTQGDIIQKFERLQAMLDIGASRMEIQRLLVDVKMLVNQLPDGTDFKVKADHLVEQIKINFILGDNLGPMLKKTPSEVSQEVLTEELPGLRKAAGGKKGARK